MLHQLLRWTNTFIPKPYDFDQMYALIRSQLGGRFEIKRQYNYGFFSKMSPALLPTGVWLPVTLKVMGLSMQ